MINFKDEKYTLDEIKNLIDFSNDIPIAKSGILRCKEVQKKYDDFKTHTENIDKVVQNNYFGEEDFKLCKNRFPYNVPNGSKHFVLWCKKRLTKQDIIDILDNSKKEFGYENYIFFENTDKNKTVKKIAHYHVIAL